MDQTTQCMEESSMEEKKEANQSSNLDNDFQKTSVGDHGRSGLSSQEAEHLYEEVGFNELEHIEISAIRLFFMQFTGLMPNILEVAAILSLGVEDFVDFAIIFVILLSNASLGFHEEIKAKNSLVIKYYTF
jgi:magnesium-transporting ATPase (P-type)